MQRIKRLLEDPDLDVYGSYASASFRKQQPREADATTNLVQLEGFIPVDPERARHVRDTAETRRFRVHTVGGGGGGAGVGNSMGSSVFEADIQGRQASPPSSLFSYKMQVRETGRRSLDGTIFYFMHSYTRRALAFTRDVLAAMLLDYFYLAPNTNELWARSAHTQTFTLYDVERVLDQIKDKTTTGESSERQKLRTNLDLRAFFLDKQLHDLSVCFDVRSLEACTWPEISSLHWRLLNTPHRLCLRRFLVQPPDDPRLGLERLVPLTLDEADAEARKRHCAVADEMRLALRAYEFMLQDCEQQKNSWTPTVDVRSHVRNHYASLKPNRELKDFEAFYERVLALLLDDLKVAVRYEGEQGGGLQLRWVYESEAAFCEALQTLASRRGHSVSDAMTATPPQEACSEQQEAWQSLRRYPFMMVDGIGGSGKSALASMIAQRLPPHWLGCTAATAAACTNMSDSVHGRAWHMHRLLHAHSRVCDPLTGEHLVSETTTTTAGAAASKEPGGKNGKGEPALKMCDVLNVPYRLCQFHDWRLLVLDEGGMAHPSAFGVVLLLIVTCAPQLERILFIGDHRQLPPIRWGFMWREMMAALRRTPLLLAFEHNHRVRGSNASELVENCYFFHREQAQDFRFSDKSTFMHRIRPQPFEMSTPEKAEQTRHDITQVLERFELDHYRHQVVTHMNMYVEWLSEGIEAFYLRREKRHYDVVTNWSTLHTGCKYMIKKNMPEWRVTNNEKLMLHKIVDVAFQGMQDITSRHWFLSVSPDAYDMSYVRDQQAPAASAAGAMTTTSASAATTTTSAAAAGGSSLAGGASSLSTTANSRYYDVVERTNTHARLEAGRLRFLVFCTLVDHLKYLDAKATTTTTTTPHERTFITIPAEPRFMRLIQKAGCTTVYGAQSGQSHTVVYYLPFFSKHEYRESGYTAISRPMERDIVCCVRREDFDRVMKNPAPSRRVSIEAYLKPVVAAALLAPVALTFLAPVGALQPDTPPTQQLTSPATPPVRSPTPPAVQSPTSPAVQLPAAQPPTTAPSQLLSAPILFDNSIEDVMWMGNSHGGGGGGCKHKHSDEELVEEIEIMLKAARRS